MAQQPLNNWISQLTASLRLTLSQTVMITQGTGTGRGMAGSNILGGVVRSTDWLDNGYWAVVISSNVTAIRYGQPDSARTKEEQQHATLNRIKAYGKDNPQRKATLYVAFATRNFGNTRIYPYVGVERYRAEQMFTAPSMGKFVHHRLKGQYSTTGPLSPNQV